MIYIDIVVLVGIVVKYAVSDSEGRSEDDYADSVNKSWLEIVLRGRRFMT